METTATQTITKKKGYSLSTISATRNELFGLAMLNIILLHWFQDVLDAFKFGGLLVAEHPALYGAGKWYGWWFGSLGVDVFLFLSGMGLFYSMAGDPNIGNFYKKRLVRILPTYLLMGGVFWAIRLAIKGGTFSDWWKNLCFVTFFTKGTLTLWFIGFILVMYLLYPLIHWYFNSTEKEGVRYLRFVLLLAVIMTLSLIGIQRFPAFPNAKDIVLGRIPIFLLGCFLGKYIKNGVMINGWLTGSLTTLFLAFGLLVRYYDSAYVLRRYLDIFPTLGLILLCSVLVSLQKRDNVGRKFLRLVGSYSLELYLTHVCVRNLAKCWYFGTYKWWVYLIVLIISVALSIPLHLMGSALGKKVHPGKNRPKTIS